jgi:Flp pilus assembly protein CpaB
MAARGRRVGVIFIVLALILVIVLGAVAYFFKDFFFPPAAPTVNNSANSTAVAPVQNTVDIVVLTQNIPFGQAIPDAALGFAPIPADRFVEGLYFKTKDGVSGKRARYQLQSGTILTSGMLSATAVGSYASGQIPAGKVAITIPISKLTSVSYALQPGDHVTVMVALLLEELDPNFQSKLPNNTAIITKSGAASGSDKAAGGTTMTMGITGGGNGSAQGRTELDPVLNQPVYVQGSETQRPRMVTQVLVSDAMVLGVGLFPLNGGPVGGATVSSTPAAGGPTPTPAPAAAATYPDQITLVVTPQDAVTINYILLNSGSKFNLALRSAGDTKEVKTESVTLQFLMDQYNIPFPSKLPYGLEPRIDSLNYNQAASGAGTTAAPAPAGTPSPQ